MRQLQEAGASAITGSISFSIIPSILIFLSFLLVHLRTKSASSASKANWEILRLLVRSVSIPVIANGDVYTSADAEYLIQRTECAGVMMGRVKISFKTFIDLSYSHSSQFKFLLF